MLKLKYKDNEIKIDYYNELSITKNRITINTECITHELIDILFDSACSRGSMSTLEIKKEELFASRIRHDDFKITVINDGKNEETYNGRLEYICIKPNIDKIMNIYIVIDLIDYIDKVEDEEISKIIAERDMYDNGKRYTYKEVKDDYSYTLKMMIQDIK